MHDKLDVWQLSTGILRTWKRLNEVRHFRQLEAREKYDHAWHI